MKRLLLALLLFSSPVLAEKYTIYTTERPPSSWSGIIDSEVCRINLDGPSVAVKLFLGSAVTYLQSTFFAFALTVMG